MLSSENMTRFQSSTVQSMCSRANASQSCKWFGLRLGLLCWTYALIPSFRRFYRPVWTCTYTPSVWMNRWPSLSFVIWPVLNWRARTSFVLKEIWFGLPIFGGGMSTLFSFLILVGVATEIPCESVTFRTECTWINCWVTFAFCVESKRTPFFIVIVFSWLHCAWWWEE